jgi:hypothetical protein
MIQHSENSRREMTNAEAGVVGAVLGFGLIALLLYLAVERFHNLPKQVENAPAGAGWSELTLSGKVTACSDALAFSRRSANESGPVPPAAASSDSWRPIDHSDGSVASGFLGRAARK